MKIVHVIDYFHPRLGYQETFLPKAQLKAGHDACVVTSDRYSPQLYEGDAVRKVLGSRILEPGSRVEESIPTHRLRTAAEIPHNVWMEGLERKILELGPDLVIAHGVSNLTSIRVALLKLRKPGFRLIFDDHMTFGASRSLWKAFYPAFRLTFAPLMYRSAEGLVGVSGTSRLFMHKVYGFPLESVGMIPLGADTDSFRRDEAARRELRSRLEVRDDEVLFVYAGKVVPEKGPDILVDAAARLMREHDNVRALIVGNGPGPYIAEMKAGIARRGLEGRFLWLDAVPNRELYKIYSAADAGVWPREASMGMIEAMACRLPIIISDVSEVEERLEYGNGLLYQADDTLDLAGKMGLLLDRKTREEMGAKGRRLVEDRLSWDAISERFIELARPAGGVV